MSTNRETFTSRDFTFGVEFEFGIRFPEQPYSRYTEVWGHIRDTLITETGLEIMTELDIDEIETANKGKATPKDAIRLSDSFSTWVIGTDSSLEFGDEQKEDNLCYYTIEMISPVFNFGPESFQEIKKMLTALGKRFNVIVNRTCGLHVHVGRGKKGFSFTPFQHLMSTIWVFEHEISELLHKSRSEISSFCAPLHERSNLATRKYEGDLLDVILGTSNINEVVDMFAAYEHAIGIAYAIPNLRQPYFNPVKRTIEFRQHEGCLQPELVLNWVSFVVELVAWAHKISRQDLKIILSQYVDRPNDSFSIEELFKEIGFPQSTFGFWRGKVASLREAEKKEALEREERLKDSPKPCSNSSLSDISFSRMEKRIRR